MPYNILIVDDSATTRAAIERAVRLSGVADGGDVVGAANGNAGLAALAVRSFDLVLADLHMPEMGGIEMTQQMAADPRFAAIPVIIVSAEPSIERLESLKSANGGRGGVRNYMRKPFTPEAIRNMILRTLEVARAA